MCRGVHGASIDTDRDTERVIGCCAGGCDGDCGRCIEDLVRIELPSSRDFDERREFSTYGCGMWPTVVACK